MADLEDPIRYVDRASGEVETEAVYGEAFLKWGYGNPLGRLTVWAAAQRGWFSQWYGWRMNRPASRAKIAPFIDAYGVDPAEFARSPDRYEHFNHFFTRRLKAGARPIAPGPDVAVFPADGRHLAYANVDTAAGFFVKGQRFDLSRFVGDRELAGTFVGGGLLLSRLCPTDYHRFHFPVAGEAGAPVCLKGSLRSVSPLALRKNLAILWENRRVRTLVESPEFGRVLIVEIGATCVGRIEQTFETGPVSKGGEKGFFAFGGSCTATIFEEGRIAFDGDLLRNTAEGLETYAKMGTRFGAATASRKG